MPINTDGNNCIQGLAYRKNKSLGSICLSKIEYIGDAAFSYCESLRKVTIPSSVEYIGVAAFCSSALEEVIFVGTPHLIEPSLFVCCKHLKRIVVPKGQRAYFCKTLDVDSSIIFEADESQKPEEKAFTNPIPTNRRQSCPTTLAYNYHIFKWYVGDNVSLDDLFSGPTVLIGNPSYQFRRKALFVFIHSDIADKLVQEAEYEIPVNTAQFMRKYQEKYNSRSPRIFLFVCDEGKMASFYDEVSLVRANKNSITIKSMLRI